MLRQRQPRQRDEAHLRFVRAQPCCLPFCKREAEAAHLRMGNLSIGKEPTGKGEKPHDKFTVPLCPYHHRDGADAQHKSNESEWWQLRGINPWAIAADLWARSGGAERALKPPKPKREKRTPARKPRGQRTKMRAPAAFPPGRKLQSRGFENPTPQRTASRPIER